ncbi:MAG: flagellar FliJ family protein [Nitrospira sp.]|nr:flagellar FliJ family protein [Nitrospira sp.]MDH5192124.1 flagellar FliJ family protein [Nitrospira sp.]
MSLDSLRRVHAQATESLMMELSQLTQMLTRTEAQIRTMETQMQADADAYAQQARQGLTIEEMLEWQGKMDAQQAAVQEVRASIDRTTALWQQTKERLIEARQECKLLERVAERRQMAVREAMARREQSVTDEAAHRQVSVRGHRDS